MNLALSLYLLIAVMTSLLAFGRGSPFRSTWSDLWQSAVAGFLWPVVPLVWLAEWFGAFRK